MPKWKIFNKLKQKRPREKKEIEIGIDKKNEVKEEKKIDTSTKDTEKETQNTTYTPIKTYKETLYSTDHPSPAKKQKVQRERWENVDTIERKIDDANEQKKSSFSRSVQSNRVEERIDSILSEKGLKNHQESKEKKQEPPNGYIAKKNKKTGLTYYTKE
ncbi:MAG: hypothetical protein R6V50_08000 [Thermoplasmatota archaeon]